MITFDMEHAKWMADSFSASCGLDVQVLDAGGQSLYGCGGGGCGFCRGAMLPAEAGEACYEGHRRAAVEAERFGGRYIYLCRMGFLWCSAPILIGCQLAGSLVVGPVLTMEPEDYLDSMAATVPPDGTERFRALLEQVPRRSAGEITPISGLLVAVACYVGDSSRELLCNSSDELQQRHIGQELQRLKLDGASAAYPLAKENELVSAITQGDQPTARRLLNELLGHILFSSGGAFPIMMTRSVELVSVLSRAACAGGGDPDQVLSLNHMFLLEITALHTTSDLVRWLDRAVSRYAKMVFSLSGAKHRELLYRAVAYLKQAYSEKITLADAARYVGFSPAYLSRVFSQEMGETFLGYLVRLRVEQAARLLLGTRMSVGEVCSAVGFEDHSYFIKVFRRQMGATPGQYRKKQGRLDPEQERGLR